MATETTNFGLKKPAETDYYDVTVQNDNWDKADQEIKKRVEEEGGDIANTKVEAFQGNSTSWPVPAAGETVKVILGKIKKHLEDLASWRPTVSLIANIVDNCTSTDTDKSLSAKQGNVLDGRITQLYSDLKMINLYDGLNDTGNNTGETYRYNVDLKKYRRIIFSFGDTTESTGGQIFVECVTPFSNFTNGYYYNSASIWRPGKILFFIFRKRNRLIYQHASTSVYIGCCKLTFDTGR